jgi:hypothetical protein
MIDTRPRSGWLRRLGDRLFRDSDERARTHGWEITSRRLGRSYRDPRFDTLGSLGRRLVDDWPAPPPHAAPATPDSRATVSPLERAMVPLARPNPAVVAWRWRYEVGALAVLAAAVLLALPRVGPLRTVLLLVWPVAAVAAFPGLRRFAVRRLWCVLTPHRVRTGCAHAWIHSRTGRIPAVLWTSAVPVGERVTLWLRPGTTVEDLVAARDLLATACWARDAEVQRHPRHAHLAALVIVRHPAGWPGRRRRRPRRRRV